MGLCKCPKKKVTNLFCFEHRVNVCEHCLVESHSKCVVQSYLSWLADSDYDTNCTLCSMPLESKETVRLKCLHLFHWDCLDAWARRLPANTAPAGYKCQQCQDGIFPAANQTSPTIERLRSTLQRANWARAGLGLSLLPELDHSLSTTSFAPSATMPSSVDNVHNYMNIQAVLHKTNANSTTGSGSGGTTATVVDVEKDEYVQHEQQNQFIARKSTVMSDSDYTSTSPLLQSRYRDEDLPENKYKRRAPFEWLFFWSQFRRYKAVVSHTRWKRGIFYVILFILLVMTVFMVFTRVIQAPLGDDPALDLLANPNIRIAVPEQSQ